MTNPARISTFILFELSTAVESFLFTEKSSKFPWVLCVSEDRSSTSHLTSVLPSPSSSDREGEEEDEVKEVF